MACLAQGRLRQSVDICCPAAIDSAKLCAVLCALTENAGGSFEPGAMRAPFCIDPGAPEIRTLINTSHELTNRSDMPFAMGGGTYARRLANAISYGSGEARQIRPAWAGAPHGANEAMEIAQLYKVLRIYILAVARLMQLDFFINKRQKALFADGLNIRNSAFFYRQYLILWERAEQMEYPHKKFL